MCAARTQAMSLIIMRQRSVKGPVSTRGHRFRYTAGVGWSGVAGAEALPLPTYPTGNAASGCLPPTYLPPRRTHTVKGRYRGYSPAGRA